MTTGVDLLIPCSLEQPNLTAVVLNLFGVKNLQIDSHQATDSYLIRCSLRDPVFGVCIVDWQINREECEIYDHNSRSYTFSHWADV